jgi:hypothetical protein
VQVRYIHHTLEVAMPLLGKLVEGTVNWVTSPVRAVWNAGRVVVNGIEVVGDMAKGDEASLKKNLADLKDAGAGVVFAGIQAGSGPLGIVLGAVEGDARKIISKDPDDK